jgi:hypothetical protein
MLYTVPVLPDVVLTTWMQPCVVVVTTGAWRSRASSLRRQAVSTAHPRLALLGLWKYIVLYSRSVALHCTTRSRTAARSTKCRIALPELLGLVRTRLHHGHCPCLDKPGEQRPRDRPATEKEAEAEQANIELRGVRRAQDQGARML